MLTVGSCQCVRGSSLYETPSKLAGSPFAASGVILGNTLGEEAPVTPEGPDEVDANPYPARPWGGWPGVGFVECVGLFGGFWRYLVSLKTVISLSVALKSGSRSGVR